MSRTSDSSSTSSTWSLTRIGLFGSAVLLLAAIASAFLKDRSVVDNAPVAETGAPSAPAAARPASPANPVELPATVKDASIMLLEGGAKKLSDYQGRRFRI
jgi:hypothetical protein